MLASAATCLQRAPAATRRSSALDPPPPCYDRHTALAGAATRVQCATATRRAIRLQWHVPEILHCSGADNDKPMQQKQPTLIYYAATHGQSSYVAPMYFEMMPRLGFSQEQHHQPVVAFDRSTNQSNAVPLRRVNAVAAPVPMQRFSVAPSEASSILTFFLEGGSGAVAPETANAEDMISYFTCWR